MSELKPNSPRQTDALRQELVHLMFSDPTLNAYALLDGAANPALLDHLYSDGTRPEYECLYRGKLEPDIAECAPYLAKLVLNTPFCEWVIGRCWGNNWGIFALSRVDIRTLRQHFNRLNVVYDPESNNPLLFRYYDPRVLRIFLPTCDEEQAVGFFGPIEAYFAEAEDGESICQFVPARKTVGT